MYINVDVYKKINSSIYMYKYCYMHVSTSNACFISLFRYNIPTDPPSMT